MPARLTTIGDFAFAYCARLTSFSVPDGLTHIGTSAFEGCEGLTTVAIPANVTEIGAQAFNKCAPLTRIDFQGTKRQWDAVVKGEGWVRDTDDYSITDAENASSGTEI